MRSISIIAGFLVFISVDWDGNNRDTETSPEEGYSCEESPQPNPFPQEEGDDEDPGCGGGPRDTSEACLNGCTNGYRKCLQAVVDGTTSANEDECAEDLVECQEGCEDGFGCS